MSHGRIICVCGRVLVSCRCPKGSNDHVDTVSPNPCVCLGVKPLGPESVEDSLAAFAGLINGQKWDSVWKRRLENIKAELNDAEVLIVALKARKQGLENRVKYLEGLLQEIRASTAKA